jgi:GH35 family endo-1,4-beta-xylanase
MLRLSAAAAAGTYLLPDISSAQEEAAGLGQEDVSAPTKGTTEQTFVRFLLREADDSPLDDARAKLLYARDIGNDPLPQTVVRAEGRCRVALANDEPIQAVCRLDVPNFGEVYCYADNGGKGFTKVENVEFVVDAAATRLRRVRETLEASRSLGIPSDPELSRHLEAAAKPVPKEPGKARTAAAYESLSHGLHAGERLALDLAKHRISRLEAPRKDFGFGAMISGWDAEGPGFVEPFKRAFNQSTVGWYWWGPEQPVEARINYQRMDGSIQWCLDNGIKPKGFGYCYMARGATPEWMRPIETPDASGEVERSKRELRPNWGFEQIQSEYVRVVKQTAARYHGRVKLMEIINEAHDKANLWHFNHAQVLELTKAVLDAARAGSSDVQRMINHCCQWGENAKKHNPHGERAWSPLMYLDDCVKYGVDFEVIGLQLYYPQYDVFEIDRMLDRHTKFNKPIEITEIATASAPGLDAESMRPKTSAPGWHGPWSEATQADWMEAVYTLCYSKPLFQAVTWWDFSDHKGHFWPFGGMLRKDLQPKESFHRLLALQKRWGVGKLA